MTSAEIRQSYLDFFKSKGHTIVPSSSLLPDSPGLLFTNAGMNQFVPIFLNEMPCPYKPARAADTQKCIRAGGKHNDLEDVGLDTYHHTLFEMLGNWSFGDYFKKEAIEWAWELVVGIWKFPANRVYATVYSPDKSKGDPADFDQEAYDIWAKFFTAAGQHPKVHIVNGNKKDNFWMMGETGPCGPCSELHIDLTPEGDTKGSLVNTGDARCIEIWNLVFIQFNAGADGSFKPLPAKHIDTGMGFERVCSIIQGTKNFTDFKNAKISNYETDVFSPIFRELEKLSGKNYGCTLPKFGSTGDTEQEKIDIAFRVIADHIRTLSLSAADGIIPGNEGRNYVLRRILRRAVRYGRELGFHEMFFYKLVGVVVKSLGSVFPELIKNQAMVEKVLKGEEESFSKTLDRGIEMFNEQVSFILRSAGVPPAASGILPEASSSPSPGATYRKRRLPHYERPHGIYHITFTTQERRKLDDGARSLVKEAFLHFHGERYLLMAVCVMPDHVHAILQPKPKGNDKSGNLIFHTLSEILHSIKSFTAKEINKAGGKSGSVWEVEFFDRLMKSDAELAEVFEYLCANPCKEGLVGLDEPYPWLWTGCEEEDFRQDAGNGRRDACAPGQEPVISGEFAFKLYDTYGFPLDLTQLMARERGLTVDVEGFEKLMTEQRERSRAAQKKEIITVSENDGPGFKTDFVGYDQMENVAVQVLTHEIDFPKDPEGIVKARLFFSPSPFYAEMGGQVGDTGWLDFTDQSIEILDTVKAGGSVVHLTEDVPLLEALSFPVTARVDVPRRRLIQGHHSATHILHWALREVLGPNVRQKGSYVGPDRLRFDFAHIEAMKPEEIRKVEELANERIRENAKVMWM
jgi:alanyl-tRNA synthetase/REP element-mobilizing transposase RayT